MPKGIYIIIFTDVKRTDLHFEEWCHFVICLGNYMKMRAQFYTWLPRGLKTLYYCQFSVIFYHLFAIILLRKLDSSSTIFLLFIVKLLTSIFVWTKRKFVWCWGIIWRWRNFKMNSFPDFPEMLSICRDYDLSENKVSTNSRLLMLSFSMPSKNLCNKSALRQQSV